ncbi:MAG: tryptophan 7-halogenase [Thermomicrobiales bacterium]|nr:tryptophan 7-halogenase [Thermomicrobiales bacterium]
MTSAERATVAVLGGGPAGASAALELARLGIDTLLIEQTDGSGNPIGECLAPSANPLLRQLGLDEILRASNALPSHGNRSIWGEAGVVDDRDFLRDPHGQGWHLDRLAFNRALLDLAETAGVSVWRQHRITAIERANGAWRIAAAAPDGEATLHAPMLVDASGRRSLLARHARIRRHTFDSQVAAVSVLHPDRHADPLRDATTTIEAVEHGWWYTALLPDQRLAVAWFTDPDLLTAHAAWRPPSGGPCCAPPSSSVSSLRMATNYPSASTSSPLEAPPHQAHQRRLDCYRRCRRFLRPALLPRHRQCLGGRPVRCPRPRRNHLRRPRRLHHLSRPPPRRLHPLPRHPPRLLCGRATPGPPLHSGNVATETRPPYMRERLVQPDHSLSSDQHAPQETQSHSRSIA